MQQILNDKFGSVDERMEYLKQQAVYVENVEEELMKAMDLECIDQLHQVNLAKQQEKSQDQNKEVTKIYDKYLAERHPNYPQAIKMVENFESQTLPAEEQYLRERELNQ